MHGHEALLPHSETPDAVIVVAVMLADVERPFLITDDDAIGGHVVAIGPVLKIGTGRTQASRNGRSQCTPSRLDMKTASLTPGPSCSGTFLRLVMKRLGNDRNKCGAVGQATVALV